MSASWHLYFFFSLFFIRFFLYCNFFTNTFNAERCTPTNGRKKTVFYALPDILQFIFKLFYLTKYNWFFYSIFLFNLFLWFLCIFFKYIFWVSLVHTVNFQYLFRVVLLFFLITLSIHFERNLLEFVNIANTFGNKVVELVNFSTFFHYLSVLY